MTTHYNKVDCHTHVFMPEIAPYTTQRNYTPGHADITALENHLEKIGASHVVVVQPSPHGTDNRATLSAITALGPTRARAIAVVDPRAGLDRSAGVIGLRANLKTSGVDALDVAEAYLTALDRLMKGTDLLLELFVPLPMLIALRPKLAQLGRQVILDHWAGFKTTSPTAAQQLDQLQDLLSLPNVVLKVSGSCRATDYSSDVSDLDPIADRLFDAAPGRVIWGSDWPHTGRSSDRRSRPLTEIEPFMPIDDRAALNDLKRWAKTPERYANILWDTPKALFGF